jgi:6-pyruvoyltetrahydropterin/6-carboxytetrahydropterin synthase
LAGACIAPELTGKTMRIFIDFNFEAAHHLPHSFPDGHVNQRLHGHSFRVRVSLQGRPDPKTGLIADLGAVKITVDSAKDALDHRYLNEIAGLELPTLETIAIWLWRRIAPDLPALAEIGIYRDSCGEGCEYQGEFETLEEAA